MFHFYIFCWFNTLIFQYTVDKFNIVDGAVVTKWDGAIKYFMLFVSLNKQLVVSLLLATANRVALCDVRSCVCSSI